MQIRQLLSIVFITSAIAACGESSRTPATTSTAKTTPAAVHQQLQSADQKPLIVDVREPEEYEQLHIEGARLAPLGKVAKELEGVEKDRDIVLVCRSGNRSGQAQKLLASRGYTSLRNMEGGMIAWEKSGLPVVKKQ